MEIFGDEVSVSVVVVFTCAEVVIFVLTDSKVFISGVEDDFTFTVLLTGGKVTCGEIV